MSLPSVDRIAQAIGDPGSIVGRKLGPSWGVGEDGYAEREESVIRWGARAVLALLTTHTDPLILRLPEVPEGTEALVSLSTGARWVRHDLVWQHEQGGPDGAVRNLAEILWIEHLGKGGVRVELAPPREPRTAAEVWAKYEERTRSAVRMVNRRLADALDREAGL